MLHKMLNEDSGQDLIEYSLIAALISVLSVLAISSVGNALNLYYGTIVAGLP